MRFGGVQKTSFIDYPGEVCSILFTQGCNYACPYCHNADLITFKDNGKKDENREIIELLLSRKRNIDAVTITGGEPTAQPDLIPFMRELKSHGFKIKLDTNGSNPQALKQILDERLANYVAIDAKTSLKRYHEIAPEGVAERVQASAKMVIESGVRHEFRTTAYPVLVGLDEMRDIAVWIDGADAFYLQQFVAENSYLKEAREADSYSMKKLEELLAIVKPHVKTAALRGVNGYTPAQAPCCTT